jgi:hypothetical protein
VAGRRVVDVTPGEYRVGTSLSSARMVVMRKFHVETCPKCHGELAVDEDGRRADSPGVTGYESGTMENPCRCQDEDQGENAETPDSNGPTTG